MLVDNFVFGPAASGGLVTVPITPTTGGELFVIAIAGTYGGVRMIGGSGPLQVGVGGAPCNKPGAIQTLGDIAPGISSFEIQTDRSMQPFVLFVMRFTGLPPDTGARLSYNYWHGTDRYPEPALGACAGSVIVSLATSCGSPAPAPDSRFTAFEAVDGMSAAYLIAPEPGWYTANWTSSGVLASTSVELGSGINLFSRSETRP